MSETDQDGLNQALARAIYSTSSPLSLLENKYFQEFFKIIRPSYTTPSRFQLSTSLLDKEFGMMHKKVISKIKEAESLVLLSDGWTDINGISLVNILFCTPLPMFFKTIESKTDRHTSEYMASVYSKAIEEVDPAKVDAIVTDNARNMVGSWKILKEKYPHLVSYGCVAHGVNLLLKDLFEVPTISKCAANVKTIIKFFKNKQIPKQALREVQLNQNQKEIALITAVETR